jgi:hypothetical protein
VWLAACVGIFTLSRAAVALPEHCGDVTVQQIDASIAEGVAWLDRNQSNSGLWLYRYDVESGEDLGGYNWVRHAGVLLSLEQTARYVTGEVGKTAALVADRGWPAIEGNYQAVRIGDTPTLAMKSSSSATGGTALTGIALAERRLRTGDVELNDNLLTLMNLMFRFAQLSVTCRQNAHCVKDMSPTFLIIGGRMRWVFSLKPHRNF